MQFHGHLRARASTCNTLIEGTGQTYMCLVGQERRAALACALASDQLLQQGWSKPALYTINIAESDGGLPRRMMLRSTCQGIKNAAPGMKTAT
jgi:hypothetical protein